MLLTDEILLLTINATARALRLHGDACLSALPISPPRLTWGNALRLDRQRAQALLVTCAVTQLQLHHARARIDNAPALCTTHRPASAS